MSLILDHDNKSLASFECDRCKAKHLSEDFVEMQEMLHWKNKCGYGSVWGGGNTVEITMCKKVP